MDTWDYVFIIVALGVLSVKIASIVDSLLSIMEINKRRRK